MTPGQEPPLENNDPSKIDRNWQAIVLLFWMVLVLLVLTVATLWLSITILRRVS